MSVSVTVTKCNLTFKVLPILVMDKAAAPFFKRIFPCEMTQFPGPTEEEK